MSIQSINLTKGQRVDIGMQRAALGLGWDPNPQDTSDEFDLDASALMLGSDGKVIDAGFLVYYNSPQSSDGSVMSSGDNRDGEGDGDDETLFANLTAVDPRVQEIVFVATIYDATARRQNFGQVRSAFIRIYDQASGEEICKYELDEDFSTESAVEFGRLYRKGGSWKFEAIGRGNNGGLEGILAQYT
jgi:tellurium resistance protein TerD